MKQLRLGKLPIPVLISTVLEMTGSQSASVVTPPKAGLDFAAIRTGGGYLIVSADPITGAVDEIGDYAINVSANDVATSGTKPQFAESVLLLPEGSSTKEVREIAGQMHSAARKLGIAIVGGHTEVTPGLKRPIVVATVFGFVKSYVSSADARAGDLMMMTKSAGLEGTAILAGEANLIGAGVRKRTIQTARAFLSKISVVSEATAAYGTGYVHAMHDCTEGGVLGAAFEMSLASGLGFRLFEEKVKVAAETDEICAALGIDPLKLIGSGSLLLAVKKGREGEVARALRGEASVVGEFTRKKRVLVGRGGSETAVKDAPEDELWRAVGRPR